MICRACAITSCAACSTPRASRTASSAVRSTAPSGPSKTFRFQEQAMSRRHSAEKREIIPDAKFGDIVVAKFMNTIMYEGKKSVAEKIVYGALDGVETKV